MNGYFQIPIHKLAVKDNKLSFKVNGKLYKYSTRSKLLLRLANSKNHKISQVLVGFMIKDNKVISIENIEIIKKKLNTVDSNYLKILLNKSKQIVNNKSKGKSKKKVNGENKKGKKKEKVKKIKRKYLHEETKRLAKRKNRISLNRKIKLTHRFKSMKIDLKKINFENQYFVIKIGDYIFSENAPQSEVTFNKLKKRKEIKLDNIPIKVNEEIVIIDNKIKILLLKQFKKAKSNYLQEQSLKLEYEKFQNKKARKERRKNNSAAKSKVIKETNPKETIKVDNNWSLINFFDGKFTYKGIRYINKKSRKYLNHLRPFFSHKHFEYRIILINNKIASVEIPNAIFDLIKLGKKINDILLIRDSRKNLNLRFTLKEFNLTYQDILSIFGKSKTFYLEYLFTNHVEGYDIICIPEPVFQSHSFVRNDISFIFMLGNSDKPYAIWESVEANKASYLFKIDYDKYSYKKVIQTIEHFLLLKKPYKRSLLQRSNSNLIEGVSSITSIKHEYYYESDIYWLNTIQQRMKKRR
jgi:hypothetical protein